VQPVEGRVGDLILATVATIGLIALGATSIDAAVRRTGAKGWQQLHNAIYAIAALALIHYLLSPDAYPEQYLMSGLFFWLMAWRVLNRHVRNRYQGIGSAGRSLKPICRAS